MTKLNERERRELLEDASSDTRRADFERLRHEGKTLTATQYLDFLNWASSLMAERPGDRPLINGHIPAVIRDPRRCFSCYNDGSPSANGAAWASVCQQPRFATCGCVRVRSDYPGGVRSERRTSSSRRMRRAPNREPGSVSVDRRGHSPARPEARERAGIHRHGHPAGVTPSRSTVAAKREGRFCECRPNDSGLVSEPAPLQSGLRVRSMTGRARSRGGARIGDRSIATGQLPSPSKKLLTPSKNE